MKPVPTLGIKPRESVEALALAAWNAIPDASSLVFDTECRYIVARGPALALHGFTSTDLEGQLAETTLPPELWKLYEPLYHAALEGETCSLDVTSTDQNHWCRVQVGPLLGADGSIVGGVSLAVDTTDLKRGEARYRSLLASSPNAMVVVDERGVIEEANAECQRLFGYPREALLGAPVEMLIPERFHDKHRGNRVAFTHTGGTRSMGSKSEFSARHENGSEFPVDISLSTHESDEGLVVTAVIRDLRAQQELAESLTLLETLNSTAPVGIAFVDCDFRILRINETLAAVNGAPVEDQIGRPVAELVPEVWPQLEPAYRHVMKTGEVLAGQDIRFGMPEARVQDRVSFTSFYPVFFDGTLLGIGMIAVDVTEARAASDFREAVMDNMAEGVYVQDHEGLLTYMNAAATRLLGFSEDELLGKSMHDAVHFQHADGTNFPADECEILKSQVDGQTVRRAEETFTRKNGEIFPAAYSSAPMRIGADEKGRVVVFRDISAEQAEKAREERELWSLVWVGRIREALDEDRLILYSQPIVPLGDDPPREELLLRMLGRDGDLIPPGSFLPAAEKYGLIGEIDRWVISEGIRRVKEGHRVDINLSAASVSSPEFVSEVEMQISKSNADPSLLGFEITETALMQTPDVGKSFAERVLGLGCSLSLDDFGTGYGGLMYLKQLPFTFVKIDLSFIQDLSTSKANQHVVEGIVNLAQGFGCRTIAEGVEDADTLQLLRDLNVDFVQGHHIGRPVPT